jgi:putative (di)nucleoside polyphosphate hydrolase
VIDGEGYRANVGIILLNPQSSRVLWGRRIRQKSWQFPQGGLNEGDTTLSAMYRELHEEIGLRPQDIEVLAVTKGWFRYRLPPNLLKNKNPLYIGQKQKWYLLRLCVPEARINLNATHSPEFDAWRWVDYWYPLNQVISFKRHVYRKAMEMLFPVVSKERQAKKGLTIQNKKDKMPVL